MGTFGCSLKSTDSHTASSRLFLLRRVDYYYREQWIIICGPNLKTSPSFKQEANKRRSLPLWVGRKARQGIWVQSEGQSTRPGHLTRLFQEAALVYKPYLRCVILTGFLHCGEHCNGSQSTTPINKGLLKGFLRPDPSLKAGMQNLTPERLFRDGTGPRVWVYSHWILTIKTNQIPKWRLDNLRQT